MEGSTTASPEGAVGDSTPFSIADWETIIARRVERVDERKREYTRWTAAAITATGVSSFFFLDALPAAGLSDMWRGLALLVVLVYLAVRMAVGLLQPFVTSALAVLLAAIKVPQGPAEAAANYLAIGERPVSRLFLSPIGASAAVTITLAFLELSQPQADASGDLRLAWQIRGLLLIVFLVLIVLIRRQTKKLLPHKDEFLKQAAEKFPPNRYRLISGLTTLLLTSYYMLLIGLVGGAWLRMVEWSQQTMTLVLFGLLTGALVVWARIAWLLVVAHSGLLHSWEKLQRQVLRGDLDSPSRIRQAVSELVPTDLP